MGKISGEEGWISLGPWGGNGGSYSSYKPDGPIMQIIIRPGDVIDSILFKSKSRDGVVIGSSIKIGGVSVKFCIDKSIEQFSSVSLKYYKDYCGLRLTYKDDGYVVLTSLCFNTNLKKYGSFGSGGDHSVSIPIEGGVIAGLHGRGGRFLDAIGIFVAPKVDSFPNSEKYVNSLHSIQDPYSAPTQLKGKIIDEEGWISLGPWGGKGGVYSTYKDGPIMQITIRYGDIIDSILFESKSRDGVIIGSSVKIGSNGGSESAKFCIDSSVEQLSSLSLAYNDYYENVVITSLCFSTNLKKYGPFGLGRGHSMSITVEGGIIVGFHGRGGTYLDAIGIIVAPIVAPKVDRFYNSEKNVDSLHSIQDSDSIPTQLKGKIRSEEGLISLGPWGGKGGVGWAYNAVGPIMQITIRYGVVIESILFESKSCDGENIGSSVKFGGSGGDSLEKFCIDSSAEQLSSISLTYVDYHGEVAIISLCLTTNLNVYGPFGSRSSASSVSIPIKGGVIAGFHGRIGKYLTAVGIFMAPEVKSFPCSEQKVDSLHSIQDPDSTPTQPKGEITHEEGWISLGPWGGNDGVDWTYKPDGAIMQISIRYGDVIHSILFESKSCDDVVIGSSMKLGGTGGDATGTFCIDSSVEQLSSISLTWKRYKGKITIASLCFNTNLKKYGPYGSRTDACLSIPIESGIIVGFHGRSGTHLTAIGIFVAPEVNRLPNSEKKIDSLQSIREDSDSMPTKLKGKISAEEGWISLGPWGGNGGIEWAFRPDRPITQITIQYGDVIHSILFESKSCDGVVIGSSMKLGNGGGSATETFCIDSSIEQLSSISLTYGVYDSHLVIESLCITTNLKKYGPFGLRSGASSSVSIPIEGGVIAGFHGRGGRFLDAIGIFVAPKVDSLPNSEKYVNSLHSIQDQDFAQTQPKGKISNEEGLISLGPWGGKDGVDWAYKPDGPIMQFNICYGEAINSILFRSRSCDGFVIGSSEKFGGTGGHTTDMICIDCSIEQLSSISLTYGDYYGQVAITSLYFETNIGNKYGPFGTISGTSSQSIPIEGGVIVGFHGRGGTCLTAIGIFVEPKVNNLPSSAKKFDSLHSVQDPNYAPTQLEDKINSEEGWTSLGPWGGKDGVDWAYKVNGPIMHINIGYGKAINSILCESKSYDGIVIGSSGKIGSTDGHVTETFCIDTSEEQLMSIILTYDDFNGKVTMISTLCFNTNLNKYGPFGSRLGNYSESIPIEGGVFGGFHGRTDGRYITAIGIFVAPTVNSLHSIEDPNSAPIQLKVLDSGVGSKPKVLETPIIISKWSLRFLVAKFKANFCSSKPNTLENTIIHNDASRSLTTNKDDHHGGASSPSSEMIHLATSTDDHRGGALSPTSKMIHSDLILLDTAFAEAEDSMHHMNVKITQAHEKFKKLQILPSSERDSDKKELRKAIAKLKVQIRSHIKIRSANSKPHHKNWDNINGAENGMTHFFHKDPKVAHTGDFNGLLKDFQDLPEPLRCCLSCFFKFPPMATIKRTPMIYLWIGQGYISEYLHSEGYVWDVEVHAGKIFDELIAKGFIEPIYQNYSLVPDSCKMSLSVRSSLYEEAKLRGFTSNGTLDLDPGSVCGDLIRHSSCLINVGEAIINFQPEIFENMKHIRSLYLGRWQSSATHHIELANAKILHGLNKLNSLTFLSLRGISMIIELPTYILELHDLMILDLRACHNLEVIPDKIGLLKSLTHLDISDCYSLENMPKSLAQLSNLQVLKGFLIGDFNNNNQSCTLSDLSELQKLRKLNIHISVKDLVRLQDLEYLERFEGLRKLKISWGRLQARAEVIAEAFSFATLPPRLQKLDLQGFPMTSLTDWLMPGKVKELKKLYIRGGQLHDLGEIQKRQAERLTVEILQLKYLSKLELHWRELRTLFPNLIYLHQVECPNFFYFQCDERGMWMDHMAIDTHVQLQKYLRTCGTISSSSMLGSSSTSTQDNCNICPVNEKQI